MNKQKLIQFYSTHKRESIVGAIMVTGMLLFVIGAIIIRLNQSPAPSATVAFTPEGFSPETMTLLVDDKGTDLLFVNDSDQELDISESSTNPEVFQVGIVESKNITKPKKVHISKSGVYTFTNNKETNQTAVIEVITTEQLQEQ